MEALAERLDLQALVAGLQAATPLVEDGEGPQDDTDTARETEGGRRCDTCVCSVC